MRSAKLLPMAIGETFNDVISITKQRVKNPFLGSFILAWLVTNYYVPYIILSGHYSPLRAMWIIHNEADWPHYLYLPLGFALFYTLAVPYIVFGLSWVARHAKKLLKKSAVKDRSTELDSDIVIAEKERELADIISGNRSIADLQKQVTDASTEIIELQELRTKKDQRIQQLESDLNELEEQSSPVAKFTIDTWNNYYEYFIQKEYSKYLPELVSHIQNQNPSELIGVQKTVATKLLKDGVLRSGKPRTVDLQMTKEAHYYFDRMAIESTAEDRITDPFLEKRYRELQRSKVIPEKD